MAEAFSTFPRRGKVKVEKKVEVAILRTLDHGNCQFRADHEDHEGGRKILQGDP